MSKERINKKRKKEKNKMKESEYEGRKEKNNIFLPKKWVVQINSILN